VVLYPATRHKGAKLPGEIGQSAYMIRSADDRHQIEYEIVKQLRLKKKELGDGNEHNSIVCHLTVAGLQAILDAGSEGIGQAGIVRAIGAARKPSAPGPHTQAKALQRVLKAVVPILAKENYELAG